LMRKLGLTPPAKRGTRSPPRAIARPSASSRARTAAR
jgi:hypothetical protein